MNELLKAYLIHTGLNMDNRDVTSFYGVICYGQQHYAATVTYTFDYKGHKHSSESTETVSVSDLLVFLFERQA